MKYFICLLLFITNCNTYAESPVPQKKSNLIKINYSDTNYNADLSFCTRDTNTPLGWHIEYFVCDTNPYKDLYIKWSKAEFSDTIRLIDLLSLYNTDYIPSYYFENNHYLFFSYSCASLDCEGIKLLRKDSSLENKNFIGVVSEIDSSLIIYTNHTYSFPTKEFICVDLKKQLTYHTFFKQAVMFDSIQINNNALTIFGKQSERKRLRKRCIKLE